MQNKNEKTVGKSTKKYWFGDGFGKRFGRVWEGLEGIEIRLKKDVKIRGRGPQVPISALGRNLYRGELLGRSLEKSRGIFFFQAQFGAQNEAKVAPKSFKNRCHKTI